MLRRVRVHGHRGARAVLPENTIPAFLHAIEAGADAIELDLAVTRDDVPVVTHDLAVARRLCAGMPGPRLIRKLTLDEVLRFDCGARRNPRFPRQKPAPGAGIPTLDEVLALASRGDFEFDLEAKIAPRQPRRAPPPERFAELIAECVRARGLESRVVVMCFDFRLLAAMKRIAPEVRLAALCGLAGRDFAAMARAAGAAIVAPYHRMVTAKRVAAAHAADLRVVPWTANRPRDWARLIRAGVDGIITDDPAALIGYLRQQESDGLWDPSGGNRR